ncbi:MAG: 30S ribosomal protein S1 [Balneolales bacterium]
MTEDLKKEALKEEEKNQAADNPETDQQDNSSEATQDPEVDHAEKQGVDEDPTPSESIDEYVMPSFSGDRDEKVYTLEELEEASEDYDDAHFGQLVKMYEGTLTSITEKEIVTGRVIALDEKYVIVDIGFKSEGIIPRNEFKEADKIEPGVEIEVFLDKVEDREGQLVLSRRKANTLRTWQQIDNSFNNQSIIEGYIKKRIKGGMVVDIFGIDAFLPGSQIDVRPVRDFDAYVGKTMEFMVVKLNMTSENVVVSHRALVESDLEDQRDEILQSMETGQILEGVVKNITDFGVFIDLGGVDGLLHITDLSWGRVEHPQEIVKLDQKLNVVVLEFDEGRKRISLGLKQLQPHPWEEINSKYPEGTRVQGRVVSIADYGAFIELEKGVEGLVHISEMSWTQHIKHPSQLVEKDQIIECVILNINKDEKKVSLGVKQLQNDPWKELTERYPIGSKHKGVVRNLTNFGVFVELEPGIDGLVHISDLSWTEKITHPSEKVNKGDEVDVSILSIDFENRRISLGHKQVTENPWEKFGEEYAAGAEIEAKVLRTTDKGIFAELPLGAEAFLPKKEAAKEAEEYSEGETIKAVVTDFDEENKSIVISEKQVGTPEAGKKKAASKKASAKKAEAESQTTGRTTLGEMSGLADLRDRLAAQESNPEEIKEAKPESKGADVEDEKVKAKRTAPKSKTDADTKKADSKDIKKGKADDDDGDAKKKAKEEKEDKEKS